MEKLKFLLAMGLCVALLFLPLTGMADNPLPQDENADGHPWDDGENDEATDPGDPIDTLPEIVMYTAAPPNPDTQGSTNSALVSAVVIFKMKVLSGFGFWRLLLF